MSLATAVTARDLTMMLQGNKLAYRSFGPYWWVIKSFLKAANHLSDLGISKAYFPKGWEDWTAESEDPFHEALHYSAQQYQANRETDTTHQMITADGEDVVLIDPDME